ncbi:MAG: hypothetical protein ACXADY_10525 [Candidatus Hodarchaeales archaeon]
MNYNSLIKNPSISKRYKDCLVEFIETFISKNENNIQCIMLFGGIVREQRILDQWSDIDILIIFKDIRKRNSFELAKLVNSLSASYSIRLDINQMSLSELEDMQKPTISNSILLNILSIRKNVSMVLYGEVPKVEFSLDQEKRAAIYYINSTLYAFREYTINILYTKNSEFHLKRCLGRLIRWVFSIIRSSLRLYDVFCHPYEESVKYLKKILPELDIDYDLLYTLIEIRNNYNTYSIISHPKIFVDIEHFIEDYCQKILGYDNE